MSTLRIWRPLPRLALISASTVLLLACSRPAPVDEPVRAVKVLTVGASAVESALEFSGEIRPRIESRLSFRVGGKLIRRHVELGQTVKAGQILAQLDPQDYALAVEAAQAQLGAAVTNRDLAAADFKRFQELRAQNFISHAELERREATFKAAQAQVDQAQAQLNSQRNQSRYATLASDVSGVVTAIEAEPGQVVSAGLPVVRVAQDGPRDAVFSVPEDKLALLAIGDTVQVRVWPGQRVLDGKVRELAASADPVTRTYQIKVALALPQDQAAPPLGATVTVLPPAARSGTSEVLKLPTTALRQQGQTTSVWVLDPASMTVKAKSVEIARADGNQAVVASGLSAGMQVVATGVHVLTPGQKVTIYRERTPASMTSPAQTPVAAGAAPAAGTAPR